MRFKNEVFVGLVVVLGLFVLVAGAFWLSSRPFGKPEQAVLAIFREVGQLRTGNPVVYRGVNVGRVTRIELASGGQGVLVEMRIRPDVGIAPDAVVVLSTQSFFGDWQAQITTQSRFPELEFSRVKEPGILPGAALPDITELTAVAARISSDLEMLSSRVQLAFTEETAIKIRQTIDNVQEASSQLTGFIGQQTETYRDVSQSVLATTQSIQRTAGTAERVAEQVGAAFSDEGEVRQILLSAQRASANLEQLSADLRGSTEGLPGLVARADTTLATVGRVANSLGGAIETVQPQLGELGPTIAEARSAMATLQRAAERIEQGEGTLGRLMEDPALYEETQAAISTLRRLMADVQANPAKYLRNVKISAF
jgi:phospholipid/cholesterol/gamma-HCH transport system substrate-binding protein